MNITQEQISQAVSSALPDVLAGIRREITETAIVTARGAAQEAVRKAVAEWVTAELIPEITTALAESKQGLIAFAPTLAAGITEALSTALHESIKKKLESSWSRQTIFKALLD